jgi:hypothetical protein
VRDDVLLLDLNSSSRAFYFVCPFHLCFVCVCVFLFCERKFWLCVKFGLVCFD